MRSLELTLREKVALLLLMFLIVGVAAANIATWPSESGSAQITLKAEDRTCGNQSFEHDNRRWETLDVLPASMNDADVSGTFEFVGDEGTFIADADFQMRYEAREWSNMQCFLRS